MQVTPFANFALEFGVYILFKIAQLCLTDIDVIVFFLTGPWTICTQRIPPRETVWAHQSQRLNWMQMDVLFLTPIMTSITETSVSNGK